MEDRRIEFGFGFESVGRSTEINRELPEARQCVLRRHKRIVVPRPASVRVTRSRAKRQRAASSRCRSLPQKATMPERSRCAAWGFGLAGVLLVGDRAGRPAFSYETTLLAAAASTVSHHVRKVVGVGVAWDQSSS